MECRTSNIHELETIHQLQQMGYTVYKRGWPDLIAVRDDDIRFIEVKNHADDKLKPHQQKVADLLSDHCGIVVEVASPPNYALDSHEDCD